MKKPIIGIFVAAALTGIAVTQEPKKVEALPPLALDHAFGKAATVKELNEALLNDATFKKAVVEALAAKKKQEDQLKRNPKLLSATHAQAARIKFLEILQGKAEN